MRTDWPAAENAQGNSGNTAEWKDNRNRSEGKKTTKFSSKKEIKQKSKRKLNLWLLCVDEICGWVFFLSAATHTHAHAHTNQSVCECVCRSVMHE